MSTKDIDLNVNVSKTELPSSSKAVIKETSPREESGGMVGPRREEDLLRSPSGASSDERPQGLSTESTAVCDVKDFKKNAKKRRARIRRRLREKETEKEKKRLRREGLSLTAENSQATVAAPQVADASVSVGRSDRGPGDSSATGQSQHLVSRAGSRSWLFSVPTRGPEVRRAKREAKRKPLVHPTVPCGSSAGGEAGRSASRQIGRTVPTTRRSRTDQDTPPERQKKKPRGTNAPMTARGGAHVSYKRHNCVNFAAGEDWPSEGFL